MTLQRPTVQQVTTGRGIDLASTVEPSAAALAANERLIAWRREAGINYRQPGAVEPRSWLARLASDDLDGSAASRVEDDPAGDVGAPTIDHGAALDQLDHGAALAGVMATVYPSLAAAFMASKHVAPVGRLWLLLRAWDTAGRGCYTLDQVYRAFSVEGSAWHVADRRQVQRLIKQGAGTFWTLRDYHGGRYHGLQMTGPAGVALALGVSHLDAWPVRVPVADLLQGMHRVGAALYAAAVNLRLKRRGPRPVTRDALASITGRAASTQRTYSKTARIEVRPNYVLLPCGDVDAPGVFLLHDHLGQQGRAGRVHLARRMPNSYVVPLAAASRGRLRKINRRLNLVLSVGQGYRPEVDYRRIYHDTATGAARAFGRDYHHDHYWPCGKTAAGADLWHVVEAVNP